MDIARMVAIGLCARGRLLPKRWIQGTVVRGGFEYEIALQVYRTVTMVFITEGPCWTFRRKGEPMNSGKIYWTYKKTLAAVEDDAAWRREHTNWL